MGEWKKVKLKDVLIEGSKERVDDTSKYQKLTIKLNFKGMEKSKVREKMADRRPFYIRKKGEIVIGKQNYFNGSIAILPDELDGGICSNAIMSFKTKKEYNNKYIYYLLSDTSFINRRSYLANGTGQKELSEKDFLNFEVIIPNINEQEKIVHILENVDLIIKNYEILLDKKKKMVKSIFEKIIKTENIEMLDLNTLITSIIKGPFGSDMKKSLYVPKARDTYKVYLQINVIEKDYKLGEYWISKDYFEKKMSRYEVKPKDFIITCDGTLGKIYQLEEGMEKGVISSSLMKISINSKLIDDKYFEIVWRYFVLKDLYRKVGNTALKHLPSAKEIQKIKIPYLSLERQKKISKAINLIDRQKMQLEEIIENYKIIKKGLMQQLLTGKIRVKI